MIERLRFSKATSSVVQSIFGGITKNNFKGPYFQGDKPPPLLKKSIFSSGLWFSHAESLVDNGKFKPGAAGLNKQCSETNGN